MAFRHFAKKTYFTRFHTGQKSGIWPYVRSSKYVASSQNADYLRVTGVKLEATFRTWRSL